MKQSLFQKTDYGTLNSRQQENFNFHKVAGKLADYGFNSLRLTDDWQGADFIACHIDGEIFLKVQLKGRLTIDKKYIGKNIHITFLHDQNCYLYPHDQILSDIRSKDVMKEESERWAIHGGRSRPQPPSWAVEMLLEYRI